jgi:hypothetical protein
MNARSKRIGLTAFLALLMGAGLGSLLPSMERFWSSEAHAEEKPTEKASDLATLRAELETLKGKAPDQSHAMKDVGYHFANLWFAGQQKNWPLAKFYLDETRSHLKWAVRIIPVRKTKAGDLDLNGILQALDNTFLSQIQKSIDAKDAAQFVTTYRQTLEGCYACHKAAEKPYLRPKIPEQPEARIINFVPEAKWPE